MDKGLKGTPWDKLPEPMKLSFEAGVHLLRYHSRNNQKEG